MRIKNKILTTFLSVAIISTLSVAILAFFSARDALLRTSTKQLEVLADVKANIIEVFFNGLRDDVSIVQDYYNIKKNLPVVSEFSKDRAHPEFIKAKEMLDGQLRKWLKIKEYVKDIMLVSPEGKIVYSANEEHMKLDLDKPLPDPEGTAFKEGKKEIFTSQIFQGPKGRYGYKFGLLVTAPVFDFEKKFIGEVAFEIGMDPIYKFIQDVAGLGKTGETLVVRKEGDRVLFLNPLRHDLDAALKRKIYLGDKTSIPSQEAASGKIGSGIVRDYRNKEVLSAWRYIPILGWGMVAKIDLQEVLAPAIVLRDRIAIFCFFIIILVVIASSAMAESISRPIRVLHKGTEMIGSGNLDHKVGIDTKDEIGQLSRAFDQMAGNLKKITASRDEFNREITERKKAGERLQASEVRYRRLFEAAKDGILILDANSGKVVDVNPFLENLTGYFHEELLGKELWELGIFKDIVQSKEAFLELQSKEYIRYEDLPLEAKDGRQLDVEFVSNVYEVNHKKVIQCNIRDITERKKAESQIEGQKKALDQFAIVTETDAKGKITYVNDQFCKISQYSREELIGKDHRDVVSSHYHPKEFWRNFWATIQAGKTWRGDVRDKAKDGTIFWEDTTIVPFLGKDGKPVKYLAIRVNITDRKLSEDGLQKRTEELGRVNQELKQLDQTKDEFVSNVSHELRTPLTIIRESVSQVTEGLFGKVNEKQNKYLNMSLTNVNRLGKIINDLLDMSTIEKGKLKLYKESVNMVELVKEVVANFTPQVEKKGLAIKAVVPKGRVDVFVDKERLVQVLINLVGNAYKFTDKGHIEVSVSESDTNIECRVKDTGVGISPSDRPRLFSKFEQIGRESGPGIKGTGLGLSIAKGIIELHDGQITMESEPGRGTQFIITLPKLDMSRESARNLMDRLRENTQKYDHCSVLVFSIKNFNARSDESLDPLAELVKKQLYRQSDQTVKDKGSVYVILADTKKEDAMTVAHRIRETIHEKKGKGPLKDLEGLTFNIVNLPEDGSAPEELISKLEMNKEDV